MSTMRSLGLLVEACKSCGDGSYSDDEDKENADPNSNARPSTTIVPTSDIIYCKARGMPLDHIGTNAILYFQKGAEGLHGADLKCSHPTCMNDGIKFRFCKHCNKAVAKRNFRKRHAHPELSRIQNLPHLPLSNFQSNHQYPMHPALVPSQHSTLHLQHNRNAFLREHEHPAYPVEATRAMNRVHNGINGYSSSLTTSISQLAVQPMDIDDSKQDDIQMASPVYNTVPLAWVELYHTRPTSGDLYHHQEWLQQVMTVADLGPEPEKNGRTCENIICNTITTDNDIEHGASDPVQAVREEFERNFPPRFVPSCNEDAQEQGIPKYRQHAETMSLQINTDLGDILGTNAIMLDSNGSIIISCTPKT